MHPDIASLFDFLWEFVSKYHLISQTLLLFFCCCRFPCKIGLCSTPIEYTLSQLIGSEILPVGVVKFLLYPGKLANSTFKNGRSIPNYDNLFKKYRKFTNLSADTETTDVKHIEVCNLGLIFQRFSILPIHDFLMNIGTLFIEGASH